MDSTERDRLARRGAEAELAEVNARREQLLAFLGKKSPGVKKGKEGDGEPKKFGRKTPMTQEERAALSVRMKQMWADKQAARKAENGETPLPMDPPPVEGPVKEKKGKK